MWLHVLQQGFPFESSFQFFKWKHVEVGKWMFHVDNYLKGLVSKNEFCNTDLTCVWLPRLNVSKLF
jgi:hypothetical protein